MQTNRLKSKQARAVLALGAVLAILTSPAAAYPAPSQLWAPGRELRADGIKLHSASSDLDEIVYKIWDLSSDYNEAVRLTELFRDAFLSYAQGRPNNDRSDAFVMASPEAVRRDVRDFCSAEEQIEKLEALLREVTLNFNAAREIRKAMPAIDKYTREWDDRVQSRLVSEARGILAQFNAYTMDIEQVWRYTHLDGLANDYRDPLNSGERAVINGAKAGVFRIVASNKVSRAMDVINGALSDISSDVGAMKNGLADMQRKAPTPQEADWIKDQLLAIEAAIQYRKDNANNHPPTAY